jgi:hypothetical protein
MNDLLKTHPEVFFFAFPLLWSAVGVLISRLGAWSRIATEYRQWETFDGERWRGQSAKVGWANYGNCLTVGVNQRGVHLSVFFLFRPGHPPIFVPWEDVSVTEGKRLFFKHVDLAFRRAPGARVRLSKRLADKLQAKVGTRWPCPPKEPLPIHPAQ